jgi:hypothetical protein
VGIILVDPPIVGELHENRGVSKDDSDSYGEGSPQGSVGRDTHSDFLIDFRKKRAISLAKNIG